MKKDITIMVAVMAALVLGGVFYARSVTQKAQRIADACLAEQVTIYRQLLSHEGRSVSVNAAETVAEVMRSPLHVGQLELTVSRGAPDYSRIQFTGTSYIPVAGPTFDELKATGALESAPSELRPAILNIQHLRDVLQLAQRSTS